MRLSLLILAAALTVAVVPGGASAVVINSLAASTGWVGGLTDSPPGVPVALDFTLIGTAPAELVGITLGFDTLGVMFGQLKIKLDAGPDVYSFDSPNGTQVTHVLYDPAWSPVPSTPHSVLPQLWKDELTDGVLNCSLWVEGVTVGAPDQCVFKGGGAFLIPEPAALGLLAIGSLALGRRRRR